MNKLSKGILISTLTFIYILGVSVVQGTCRNGHDVGTGILYLYSTLLYVISFIVSFSVYGINKTRKYTFLIIALLSLLYYIYLWMEQTEMPYERVFYILWGLLIYICAFICCKHQENWTLKRTFPTSFPFLFQNRATDNLSKTSDKLTQNTYRHKVWDIGNRNKK